MKPVKAEVPTSDSPASTATAFVHEDPPPSQPESTITTTHREGDEPVTYIEVLVNDSRRHPTGIRKTVRARLLHRDPMSVLVELPDGSVVRRRLRRDVPSHVPHIGR